MKFSRHFYDAQTPEWKKAYIDYRGLKAQLRVIRAKSRQAHIRKASKSLVNADADSFQYVTPRPEENDKNSDAYSIKCHLVSDSEVDLATKAAADLHVCDHRPASLVYTRTSKEERERASFRLTLAILSPHASETALNDPLRLQRDRDSSDFPISTDSESSAPLSLYPLLCNLPAIHAKFFNTLDAELDKVETFYLERENEMVECGKALRKQLDELRVHRELFHESSAQLKAQSWTKRVYLLARSAISFLVPWSSHFTMKGKRCHQSGDKRVDPLRYHQAEKRLREAVVEHYRGLEILNKYRELNAAGFRKTVETYGKITNISILDTYMTQKVIPFSFASGSILSAMRKELEHLFAAQFERGDIRKAKRYLRTTQPSKTRHLSAFRSGLWLGLALSAIVGGSYLAFQESTRVSLPSWDILLFIYSVLVIPVILALLIGINILVWTYKRVSYAFIFGLNPRSSLTHHEYFELPSFLLCTLAYSYWLSMAQIGPPILWPLVWLALALTVMLNPIHTLMWGRARWWTIKNIAKLGASGLREVEFTEAWIADQLCSLGYTFSNLFFVGCFYSRFAKNVPAYDSDLREAWSTCNVSGNWGWYYLLAMLPYIVRFVQSLRKYRDSKARPQLINAGKYLTAIVTYFCYYYWRHQGALYSGNIFILWCFTATVNSIYGCTWDFLMDWSICKPYARYPLLRPKLVYKSQVPCYYFSMVSNLFIRFSWLSNIYLSGTNAKLFSFIVALLEMLRRVQWNFYRLENQHLHNVDHFHVTRKVPLPYGL